MQKPLDARQQFAVPVAAVTDDDEIDLLAVFRTLWRGRLIIILCAFIALLIGGYYAYVVAVPTYSATATMALQMRQETVVDLESVLSGVSSDQSSINTEMEVIRSRALLTRLVDELDLLNDAEFNATLRPDPGFAIADAIGFVRGFLPGPAPDVALPLTDAAIFNDVIENVRGAVTTQIFR